MNEKKYKSRYALGWKKQWRWRCSHRDAFYVACLMWPYSHIKLGKLQKIIDHYKDVKIMNDKVVSLKDYKPIYGIRMSVEFGFGMLAMGLIAILIGAIIAYFIINKVHNEDNIDN